jgi:hypothetical protein
MRMNWFVHISPSHKYQQKAQAQSHFLSLILECFCHIAYNYTRTEITKSYFSNDCIPKNKVIFISILHPYETK